MNRPPAAQSVRPVPQLSCTLCRDRKLKCDKRIPCTNCVSVDVACVPVYRQRMPRGRHAHAQSREPRPIRMSIASPRGSVESVESLDLSTPPAQPEPREPPAPALPATPAPLATPVSLPSDVPGISDLSERVRRLERLLMGPSATATVRPEHTPSASDDWNFPQTLVAQSPWIYGGCVDPDAVLSMNMAAPADPFAATPPESLVDYPSSSSPSMLSLLDSASYTSPPPLPPDSKTARQLFCQVYLQNVDPIIKILHRPSVTRWMVEGKPYLPASSGTSGHCSRALEALEASICYAAAASTSDDQAHALFHTDRSSLVDVCRTRCEAAMMQSDLLESQELMTLQTLLLYVVARRAQDQNREGHRCRAAWTLIALAVRMARALGLGQAENDVEDDNDDTFFHRQMCHRLWLTICLVDLQAAMAQASEPLIGYQEAAAAMAHVQHINDADFDETTAHAVAPREDLTDTTFALVTYQVQLAGRLLWKGTTCPGGGPGSPSTVAEMDASSADVSNNKDWRQQQVRRFEQAMLSLLHFCDPASSTYAWFTWHSTQCLVAAVRFAAASSVSPASPSESSRQELLCRALRYLEKAHLIYTDVRSQGYRWYISMPWPALETAIAECQACADVGLVRRAWPVLERWRVLLENGCKSGRDAARDESLMAGLQRLQQRMSQLETGDLLSVSVEEEMVKESGESLAFLDIPSTWDEDEIDAMFM